MPKPLKPMIKSLNNGSSNRLSWFYILSIIWEVVQIRMTDAICSNVEKVRCDLMAEKVFYEKHKNIMTTEEIRDRLITALGNDYLPGFYRSIYNGKIGFYRSI